MAFFEQPVLKILSKRRHFRLSVRLNDPQITEIVINP